MVQGTRTEKYGFLDRNPNASHLAVATSLDEGRSHPCWLHDVRTDNIFDESFPAIANRV